MIISFDFDSTLSEKWIQEIAKTFISSGHEVHITTSRIKGNSEQLFIQMNSDLFSVAVALNIPNNRINFTEGAYKAEILKLIGADIHFDDMEDEVHQINTETDCKALLVGFDISKLGYLKNFEF